MRHCSILACAVFSILLAVLVSGCGPQMSTTGAGGAPAMGPQSVSGGILFVLYAPKAHKVAIVGDFNNWSTSADLMYDREETGLWSITLPLDPGRYEYKFFIDGERWVPDLGNPKKTKDGFGAFNSVIEVKP
jgi:1,4-alpha-glucan branching enzyme